jgi:hypothetical protein
VPNGPQPVPRLETFPTGAIIRIRLPHVTEAQQLEKYWQTLAVSVVAHSIRREKLPYYSHVAGISTGQSLELCLWLWTTPAAQTQDAICGRFREYLQDPSIFGQQTEFMLTFHSTLSLSQALRGPVVHIPLVPCPLQQPAPVSLHSMSTTPPPLYARDEQSPSPSATRTPSTLMAAARHSPGDDSAVGSSAIQGERSDAELSRAPAAAHTGPTQFQWRKVASRYMSSDFGGSVSSAVPNAHAPPSPHQFQHHVHQHYHARVGSTSSYYSNSTTPANGSPTVRHHSQDQIHQNFMEAVAAEANQALDFSPVHRKRPAGKQSRTLSIDPELAASISQAGQEHAPLPPSSGEVGRTYKKTRRGTRAGKLKLMRKRKGGAEGGSEHQAVDEGETCMDLTTSCGNLTGARQGLTGDGTEETASNAGSVVEHEEVNDEDEPEWVVNR